MRRTEPRDLTCGICEVGCGFLVAGFFCSLNPPRWESDSIWLRITIQFTLHTNYSTECIGTRRQGCSRSLFTDLSSALVICSKTSPRSRFFTWHHKFPATNNRQESLASGVQPSNPNPAQSSLLICLQRRCFHEKCCAHSSTSELSCCCPTSRDRGWGHLFSPPHPFPPGSWGGLGRERGQDQAINC